MIFTGLLWTAPEHLRSLDPNNEGSVKGDIYSLGIILHEITSRGPPYGVNDSAQGKADILVVII